MKTIAKLLLLLFAIFKVTGIFGQESKKTDPVKVNIFATVSTELEKQALEVSELLQKQTDLKPFPTQGFQIHCTLYMTNFSPDQIPLLKEKISLIAQGIRSFPISSQGAEKTAGNWFFVNVEKGRNLQQLSDLITETLSPFRDPNQFVPEWAKDFPKKVEYIEKYGSPNVFDEFNPHLTLLPKTDVSVLDPFLKKNEKNPLLKENRNGRVVGIGIGLADEFGQIPKPIVVFPLND